MPQKKARKKIKSKNIVKGIAHIHASHNNTIITFSDLDGEVFAWASAGTIGYKGTKKGTPYAAQLAAEAAANAAKEHGLKEIEIKLNGIGPGKESARKQLEIADFRISKVKDVTPTPHNGTRPPKKVLKRRR